LTILKHIKMSGKFSVITLVNVFLILWFNFKIQSII
jgi:hypothetical protein